MRRAGVVGVGGEADLVVGDQVQRAADGVAVEVLQVERLGDHAAPGERGVAVDDDRDRARRVAVRVRSLVGALRGTRGVVLSIAAATPTLMLGPCVPIQISAPSPAGLIAAVTFIGSIWAW